jgi:cellobiose phosphorylase
MVPQVMLYGFLGFRPAGDGFHLNPQLPSEWPGLAIDRIQFHDAVLKIRTTSQVVEITNQGDVPAALEVTIGTDHQVRNGRKDSEPETGETSTSKVRLQPGQSKTLSRS